MRGIDRLLAGVLLVGAVGGAAVFARQSGSDPSVRAVELAAPPLQHLRAPGTVLLTQTPAPTRVAARVRGHQVRQAAEPPTQPHATAKAQPARPTPPLPPGPLQTVTAPVQVPPPPRSLAAVQIAPTSSTRDKSHGHGRALGHAKQHGHAPPQAVAAPVAATAVVPAPGQDDGTGGSDTAGPGNGHGHAWGRGNDRAEPDGN